MPVRMKFNTTWDKEGEQDLTAGLLEMVTDVQQRAIVIAPKDTRALVNSGRIEKITQGFKLTFGNARVPYARRRHYENKKNPQTTGYLTKAADSVTRGNIGKYFRGKGL